MDRLRTVILGASGYAGGELVQILSHHPQVDLVRLGAHRQAGKTVAEVHPNLQGMVELTLEAIEGIDEWDCVDCLFLALPHGESQHLVPGLPERLAVVDLGADFRLRDGRRFSQAYGFDHAAPRLCADFVYGLADAFPQRIVGSRRVANPGCFATAVALALLPLFAENLLEGRLVADAKTGSSGSGAHCLETTHHPRRANSFYAYKPFRHQHLPEIEQALRDVSPQWDGSLLLQTHSAPLVRGIFVSIYGRLKQPLNDSGLHELFAKSYAKTPFVRLRSGSPDVNWVKNTNFADLGWASRGRDLILFSAIDNLVKGAAGQAVQNMNLMFGFPPETGLVFSGSHP